MLAADPIRGGGMLGARGRAGDEVGAAAPVPTPGAVRALLAAWRSGDDGAVERLVPLVHDALDDLTARRLRAAVTADAPPLAPLALVDDAWRALADGAPAERGDRVRFAAVASRVVRRVLAVHARRAAALRPADRAPARDEWALATMALEDALAELALLDPRLPRVVECRVFGGLTDAETAEALGVSGRTVHRDWRRARAWLSLRLAD
jgi:RNA polymerase sigma factor (TIGR02999 family)